MDEDKKIPKNTASNLEVPNNELLILKTIAETLNRGYDMKLMLESVLEKLLEVTNLDTGWIFLVNERPYFEHIADHNLPPALSWGDKRPMKCDSCSCLELYWEGLLHKAVNIVECARLEEAAIQSWGDTYNLTHHATAPITIRGERIGILNVGSPGRVKFSKKELALLESVAYQIGSAVERTRLYEQKTKQEVDKIAQYIVDYYTNTDEVNRRIRQATNIDSLFYITVDQIGSYFGWSTVAVLMKDDNSLKLSAMYKNGVSQLLENAIPIKENTQADNFVIDSLLHQKVSQVRESSFLFPELNHNGEALYTLTLPIKSHHSSDNDEWRGVLFISRKSNEFNHIEIEILKILADHVAITIDELRLQEEWQELLLTEERNRLARDLHDSVNQKLFSLSLTAQGIKEMMTGANSEIVDGISDITQLAREALSEMRSLIFELRPEEKDKNVGTLLKEYAHQIGVQLNLQDGYRGKLSKKVDEALLRIGQEALNNVFKHAQVKSASISIQVKDSKVRMIVTDRGCGFSVEDDNSAKQSLGITSMQERVVQVNGELEIDSSPGNGTVISVLIPIKKEG